MNVDKIMSELEARVEVKMQPFVKYFQDNKESLHSELSDKWFDFQENDKKQIVTEIVFETILEHGIDLNNIKTKNDFDVVYSAIQILPDEIIKRINSIYHKEIKLIVFNGKDHISY
jgi:hypothetical protein